MSEVVNKKAEFQTQITEKDLFDFNLYQTYTHSQGIISIIIALLSVGMGIYTLYLGNVPQGILYIVLGLVFLCYVPWSLKLRVKKTYAATEVFSKPLCYEATEEAIKVSQGDVSEEFLWNQIFRVVANDKRILIYTGRLNAYIIPKEQIGNQYEAFLDIAKIKLEKHRLKIK